MVRGILKEIEGVISLVIFVLFLIFYLNFYRTTIYQNINNEIYSKFQRIDEIYYKLTNEGYIVSFKVSIPKYSKELLCNINDPEIRKDFCEKHPIFIPSNLSFILKKDGILNNTNDTIFKNDIGAFLYLNLSEFQCYPEEYILIEVDGPITTPKIIFITTPTLYYWLTNNENISISTQNTVNFQYCYLLSNGICSNLQHETKYGIIIKIDSSAEEKIIFNISKSTKDSSVYIDISNLNYTNYTIIFEPKCYLNLNFLVLENLSFDFSKYTDLRCSSSIIENSKLSYNLFSKSLRNIYENVSFYNESSLFYPESRNITLACILFYRNYSSNILNVYRVLFSNTSWFFEIAEYNLSNLFENLEIFNYSHFNSFFDFNNYFNFTHFNKFNNISIVSNKLLLKKDFEHSNCSYALIFFDDIYEIYLEQRAGRQRIYPRKRYKSKFETPTISYYCSNHKQHDLLIHLYYSYSLPKVELLYINKLKYVNLENITSKEDIAFYIVNKNISIGNIADKKYSKSYYTYLKHNNSLIEDYLIIYIK